MSDTARCSLFVSLVFARQAYAVLFVFHLVILAGLAGKCNRTVTTSAFFSRCWQIMTAKTVVRKPISFVVSCTAGAF